MPIVIKPIEKKGGEFKNNMKPEKKGGQFKNDYLDPAAKKALKNKKKTKPKKVDTMKYMYGGGKLKMAKGYSAGGKIFTGR
jgi:hypothetical protein